ncbi:hypothetical protein TCDM_10003 [Trypanosoma cruzi Dm28c]|uniref:Uncharacterized protein n=1 Tax=Trypanosoma cruzi Dm28c TaxID=1416333 RepID=V5BD51_TRYCR|nr:hypothetical protein TCDM_10003 [Trypanosoma cruzi Dm28c]
MQLSILLCPPPSPHRRPQSHRRVSTTMCTTPPCSERWARRSHASPRSIFPALKCCVSAQKVANTIRVHTKPTNTLTR